MRDFNSLKIAVAGTGYVGLSIATLLSQHHQVTAVDIIPEKVELINNKKSPIQDDYIEKYLEEKNLNLTATLDAEEAYGNSNFGNKLQNYAVQEILKKEGLNTVNIVNVPCLNNNKVNHTEVIKLYIKGWFRYILKGDKIKDCVDPKDPKERKKNFLEFNKKIANSKHFFSFSRLQEFNKYDYYFVGSDQIWNPIYGGLSDLDLLTFTQKKKIAISASFGIEEIPLDYKGRVEQYISKFDAISVREEAAKSIIERITNRQDVEVLIDPTMMLQKEEWDRIVKKPKEMLPDKYIVCYFLGTETKEYISAIHKIAAEKDCEIIDLSNLESEFYCCGPSEFVYLIKTAEFVCTDSFHASVFSILYNRPFLVFDRNGKHLG